MRHLGVLKYALLALTIQTGLRISELAALTCQDITLGAGANVRCRGKGRKERVRLIWRAVIRPVE